MAEPTKTQSPHKGKTDPAEETTETVKKKRKRRPKKKAIETKEQTATILQDGKDSKTPASEDKPQEKIVGTQFLESEKQSEKDKKEGKNDEKGVKDNTKSESEEEEHSLPGIGDLSAYIASKKNATTNIETEKIMPTADELKSNDGTKLLEIPGIISVVPHAKGDHKLVFKKGDEPVGLIDDPKGRIPGTLYKKNGEAIYFVNVIMKEHPTLKNEFGSPLQVWIVNDEKQINEQLQSIKNGKGGGDNFGSPILANKTQENGGTRTEEKQKAQEDEKAQKEKEELEEKEKEKRKQEEEVKKEQEIERKKAEEEEKLQKEKEEKELEAEKAKKEEEEKAQKEKEAAEKAQEEKRKQEEENSVGTQFLASEKQEEKEPEQSPQETTGGDPFSFDLNIEENEEIDEETPTPETEAVNTEELSIDTDVLDTMSEQVNTDDDTANTDALDLTFDLPSEDMQNDAEDTLPSDTDETIVQEETPPETETVSATATASEFDIDLSFDHNEAVTQESEEPTKESNPDDSEPSSGMFGHKTQENESSPEIELPEITFPEFTFPDTTPGEQVQNEESNTHTDQEVVSLPEEPIETMQEQAEIVVSEAAEIAPQDSAFNLDDLAIETPEANTQTVDLGVSISPNEQQTIEETIQEIPEKKGMSKATKIKLIAAPIVLICLGLIAAVMFPGIKNNTPDTPQPGEENQIIDENEPTEEDVGNEDTGTDPDAQPGEENPQPIDVQPTDTDTQPTQDPEDTDANPVNPTPLNNGSLTIDELKTRLNAQQEEARKVFNIAKLLDNKAAIKFSLAAMRKAGNIIERVENDNTITASDVISEVDKIDLYIDEANKLTQ